MSQFIEELFSSALSSDEPFIEGIGQEVILAASCFLVTVVFIIALYLSWKTLRRTGIHPDNVNQVNEARQRLGVGADMNPDQYVRHTDDGDPCPICLVQPRFAVMTNCGHVFCATCILAFHDHGNMVVTSLQCPVCRQAVSILLPDFTEAERSGDDEAEDRVHIETRIHQYNRRFSGAPRSVWEHITDAPALLRYIWHQLFTRNAFQLFFRVRAVVAILAFVFYVLSPMDILPEAVFGVFGFVDDILGLAFLALYLTMIVRNVVLARAMRADGQQPPG